MRRKPTLGSGPGQAQADPRRVHEGRGSWGGTSTVRPRRGPHNLISCLMGLARVHFIFFWGLEWSLNLLPCRRMREDWNSESPMCCAFAELRQGSG